MKKKHLVLACLLLSGSAVAQTDGFREVAQRTLMTNPEVLARLHAWKAAREERAAAAGGFLPRLDLSAGGAREQRDNRSFHRDYDQNQATLTLTQMLYDGMATRNEVRRLDHAALVRFFELHDASENITLEVVRAYVDVQRYRELVSLAEENYVRHRVVFDQIQSKVEAKVGRRVDLETSAGRLALAEANLLTETANLHDVSARFTRLTGRVPGNETVSIPRLQDKMPRDPRAAMSAAVASNPALWAALENIKAAKSAARTRDASYRPRLEFQLRNSVGKNLSGNPGSDTLHSAGLVLNWNLYNGGSDNARVRQFAEQISLAEDQADKACRDMRQTLAIAYNDTSKLGEQINYLDQHQLATEKARDAYRKQFDIGQRSLLDLLDTENELFQARRAYTTAVHDLSIAHARTAASMGQLVSMLGLTAQEADTLAELRSDEDREFLSGRCQAEMPASFTADKKALEQRVAELMRETAASAAASPSETRSAGADGQAAMAFVNSWAKAWSDKDVASYLASYAPEFQPPSGLSREQWERQRRSNIQARQRISVSVDQPKLELTGETATVTFRQTYTADGRTDVGTKTLVLSKKGGSWKIVREQSGR